MILSLYRMIHVKCRTGTYPFSEVKRLILTDEQVPWDFNLENYAPPEYNSKNLINKPWADPLLGSYHI